VSDADGTVGARPGVIAQGQSARAEFECVIDAGGVVLFPSDTVYGLACDPQNARAIERLYALKGRPPDKSAAVMFFELEAALAALPELGEATKGALRSLMPGGVTALLPNPARRFALACRADEETLGLRVVSVPALAGARVAVMQSSANPSGGGDARRLSDVAPSIRAGADLVIDGGELPGVASTVVDLRAYEREGVWSVRRLGAVDEDELARRLKGRFRFEPATYGAMVVEALPGYDELQARVALAAGAGARTILDLGIGTGETSARLLALNPDAEITGLDESPAMLAAAAERLGERLVAAHVGMLQEDLPPGRFDLVVSALAVHHLDAQEKAHLFARVRERVAHDGRFVLGDVVVAESADEAAVELTVGYDKPSTVDEQLRWLSDAGFQAHVSWAAGDLAVIEARPV